MLSIKRWVAAAVLLMLITYTRNTHAEDVVFNTRQLTPPTYMAQYDLACFDFEGTQRFLNEDLDYAEALVKLHAAEARNAELEKVISIYMDSYELLQADYDEAEEDLTRALQLHSAAEEEVRKLATRPTQGEVILVAIVGVMGGALVGIAVGSAIAN